MSLAAHLPGGSRARHCALLLFLITLVCHLFVLLITLRSRDSRVSQVLPRTYLTSLRWHPDQSVYQANLSVSTTPNENFNNSVNSSNSDRIQVKPWEFKGPSDLTYMLNVDMPELVRRVMNSLPVHVEPINQPDFRLLISNANRCQIIQNAAGQPPDLLILIKSAPNNYVQRDTIRLTWGSEYCWGGRHVVRLFLLGTATKHDDTSIQLANEAAFHGDIIQQDFVDHYHNNTYKILFGMSWAVQFCSQTPLVMFVDDDFFVYPRNVVAFTEGLSVGIKERLVAGYVWVNAIPVRNNSSGYKKKWSVTWDEYPNRQYPPYVAAGNFFISMSMARELIIASRYTKYLRFDDVFLGIILKKMFRTPIHLTEIYAFTPVNESSNEIQSMLSSHHYRNPSDQLRLWQRLQGNAFCVNKTCC